MFDIDVNPFGVLLRYGIGCQCTEKRNNYYQTVFYFKIGKSVVFATSFYLSWKRSLLAPTSNKITTDFIRPARLISVCSDNCRRTTCRTFKDRSTSQKNPSKKLNPCESQWTRECTHTCCPELFQFKNHCRNPVFIQIMRVLQNCFRKINLLPALFLSPALFTLIFGFYLA